MKVRIIELTPQQIVEHWETVCEVVRLSAVPTVYDSPETVGNILEALIDGRLSCWGMIDRDDRPEKIEDTHIQGFILTTIAHDQIANIRNLLIYGVWSRHFLDEEAWASIYVSLRRYGKDKTCHSIIGYSKIPRVINLVEKMQGDASERLIQLAI